MTSERIFADTDLFLHYLTKDVPQQADAVEQLLRRAAAGQIVLVANGLVMAEIVWTLGSFYGLSPEAVKDKVWCCRRCPGTLTSTST